jgi:hypothetical protein
MATKICEKCKKPFEAKKDYYRTCFKCSQASQGNVIYLDNINALLLKSYHDADGDLLREVFIGPPQKLADVFNQGKPRLSTKQLGEYFMKVQRAYKQAINDRDMGIARSMLWDIQPDLENQLKRGIIPVSFATFIKHHLALAEKSVNDLEGFYKHIYSIIRYYPKQ